MASTIGSGDQAAPPAKRAKLQPRENIEEASDKVDMVKSRNEEGSDKSPRKTVETNKENVNEEMEDESKVKKDGTYHLAHVARVTADFQKSITQAETDLAEPEKSEEICGKLRAAIGKATLLITKRFKQFKGLCEDNLHPKAGSRVTTDEDLGGFWDMVQIQVEDVEASFKDIQVIRENNWIEVEPPAPVAALLCITPEKTSARVRTPRKPDPSKPTTPAGKRREAQRQEARKKLAEMRRKMAAKKRNGEEMDIEVIIAEPEKKKLTDFEMDEGESKGEET